MKKNEKYFTKKGLIRVATKKKYEEHKKMYLLNDSYTINQYIEDQIKKEDESKLRDQQLKKLFNEDIHAYISAMLG